MTIRGKRALTKKLTATVSAPTSAGGLDVSIVSELAGIAATHDLSEIEVEHQGLRIRVARQRQTVAVSHVIPAAAPFAAPAAAAPPAVVEPSPADHPGVVKSPMVGTAYLRPSPESKPFITTGAEVKAGEKLLLVEAMKTFNEILSPRAGRVTRILIENGSPVEYDQPLLIIE
jgi:acetyl-CoA carboxylase biotin carboxyl carrier protein